MERGLTGKSQTGLPAAHVCNAQIGATLAKLCTMPP